MLDSSSPSFLEIAESEYVATTTHTGTRTGAHRFKKGVAAMPICRTMKKKKRI
jgi:hypothetical protein